MNQHPVRQFVRELMALPNLPASHIQPAFYQLKARCPATSSTENLVKLLSYVEDTWIASSSRTPASWTNFKRAVHTNNDVEGWHRRSNGSSRTDHPNLYLLIGLLQKETSLLPLQVQLVAQHKLYRARRKENHYKQEFLRDLWKLYERDELTTSEYLRRCAALADHRPEAPRTVHNVDGIFAVNGFYDPTSL